MNAARADARRRRFEAEALPWIRPLYGMAVRLAGGTQDAGDLVQECYLRAYRTFDNFAPGSNAKAWLFRILLSVFVNHHRRARRQRTVALDDAASRCDRQALESWRARSRTLEAPDDGAPLGAALARLPLEYRSTVLLVDLEGLTYEEAAAALGCPVGTVRSRLSRARRSLVAFLAETRDRTPTC